MCNVVLCCVVDYVEGNVTHLVQCTSLFLPRAQSLYDRNVNWQSRGWGQVED